METGKVFNNNCQTGTIVKKNGKVKKVLLFECFRCDQVIPYGAKDYRKETETEIKIICEECYKKEQAEAIIERLIGEYLKENYKITKELRDGFTATEGRFALTSMEECKQAFIRLNPYNQLIWTNDILKFITGRRVFPTELYDNYSIPNQKTQFQKDYNLHERDPRTESVLKFDIWCREKSEEWGLEDPTTEMTIEEKTQCWFKWFDKWKIGKRDWNFKEIFEWLEEEDFCLK
jgi:hypothetical protein